MRSSIILLFLSLFCYQVHTDNWAVLIAGSKGFSNYRHQADICHAYTSLIAQGIPAANIIVLHHDDAANSIQNPVRGKLFNKPTGENPGKDVYQGCVIDYFGIHVTPEIFLAVLKGDSLFVKGKGTGRVLKSTQNDHVFINFADHGGVGMIAFPYGSLYRRQLESALEYMTEKKMFQKLVFYLESCESGSMFTELPKNTKIYAVSAASPSESSWGCYCPPDDVVGGKHIRSCLGDLFSVNWMEDMDVADLKSRTLQEQYEQVQKLTDKSKVMQWGDVSFVQDKLSEFMGLRKSSFLKYVKDQRRFKNSVVDSRDINLVYLSNLYAESLSQNDFNELKKEVNQRAWYDQIFEENQKRFNLSGQYYESKDNECLQQQATIFQNKFGQFSDYGLKYVKYLSEACDKGIDKNIIYQWIIDSLNMKNLQEQ